jgi:hypothetical protein
LNRNYYKLANVHILSQTLVSHHRNNIATAAAAAAAAAAVTSVTAMILSDATMGITIIEMKTKAALKAAYEHLSAAATWVVIYFCVVT